MALPGDEPRHVVAGVVAVHGHEDLVAVAETQRPEHAVHARRGVGNEDQVLRIGADDLGQPLPRGVEQFRHLPHEELHGPRFHLAAQLALPLEHHARTGPERPVVEHRDRRIERPGRCGLRKSLVGKGGTGQSDSTCRWELAPRRL